MFRRLLSTAVLGGGLVATVAAAPPAAPTVPPDNPVRQNPVPDKTHAYEGTYVVQSGEQDGKPIPKEKIDGSKVVITKDTIIGTAKGGREFFAATYTVDATDQPTRWKLRPNGSQDVTPVFALVERDGATLKIVYNLPGGPLPTAFKTVEKQHLFVLRRASEDGVPAVEKK